MSNASTMTNALSGMETALLALSAAYAEYGEALKLARYAAGARGEDIMGSLGTDRIDRALAGRMRRLGIGRILDEDPGLSGGLDASWTTKFHITPAVQS